MVPLGVSLGLLVAPRLEVVAHGPVPHGQAVLEIQPWPAAQHDTQRTARAFVRGPQELIPRQEYALGSALTTGVPVIGRSGDVYFTATYCVRPGPFGCEASWTTLVDLTPGGQTRILDPNVEVNYHGAPAVGLDGSVFASTTAGTRAFQPDGSFLWESSGGALGPVIAPDGSVVVVSGTFIPFYLEFLDPATGGVRRSIPLPERPLGLSIAADGRIYYEAQNQSVVALHPAGFERWRYPVGSALSTEPVLAPDGTVYAGTVGKVISLNDDGTVKWQFSPVDALGAGVRLALAGDGMLYVQTLDGVTVVAASGAPQWQRTQIAGGLGIVLDRDRTAYCVQLGGIVAVGPAGGGRWQFTDPRPTNVISGLAVAADGALVAVGNRFSYVFAR